MNLQNFIEVMASVSLNVVKTVIKSLIISSPDELNIEQLNKDFRRIEGCYIPYECFGYKDLESFLRSIPETVQVFGHGTQAIVKFIRNEKSDHIYEMVQKQKKDKKPSVKFPQRYNANYNNHIYQAQVNHFTNLHQKTSDRSSLSFHMKPSKRKYRLDESIQQNKSEVYSGNNSNIIKNKSSETDQESQLNTNSTCRTNSSPSNFDVNKMQNQIKEKNSNIQFLQRSHIKFTENAVDYNHLTQPQENQFPKLNQKTIAASLSVHMKTSKSDYPLEESIPQNKNEISNLRNNSNVNMNKLSKTETKSLPIEINGKNDHCLSKKSFNNITDHQVSQFFDQNLSDDSWNLNDLDTAIPAFAADSIVFQIDFHKNTIKPGEKIADYSVPENLKIGFAIRVFVTEVHNPFKFWFHILGENNKIDNLMNHMESVYNNFQDKKYTITISYIKPGQICAAFHNGCWYRAEILSDIRYSKVKCFFIDYGIIAEVQIQHIKCLLNIFSNLPSQAMRGCLSSIKPNGRHWSMKATSHFISLVNDVMLYAQIREIDQENRVFYMVICNTSGVETIQVNKDLVEKKHAIFNSI